jgi:hypothetical protein
LNENWNKGKSNQFIKGRKVKKKISTDLPNKERNSNKPIWGKKRVKM